VYGFRNRTDHSYAGLSIANSRSIQELAIWDQLAREGKRSVIIGVPPSYPPRKVNGIAIRHAVEVRHDSFKDKEFIALCRKYGVAIIFAADSEFPLIADVTADFIYARIMGTQAKEKSGYPAATLKKWAERARAWQTGKLPKPPASPRPPKKKRDLPVRDQRRQGRTRLPPGHHRRALGAMPMRAAVAGSHRVAA
jgi:hypothetical protein